MVLETARLLSLQEKGNTSAEQDALLRIQVPLTKLYTGKQVREYIPTSLPMHAILGEFFPLYDFMCMHAAVERALVKLFALNWALHTQRLSAHGDFQAPQMSSFSLVVYVCSDCVFPFWFLFPNQ